MPDRWNKFPRTAVGSSLITTKRPSRTHPRGETAPISGVANHSLAGPNVSCTEDYPRVHGYVSFRYSSRVTIPGKGGRPRKWRSDADRVRAFRARQRGQPEPPQLLVALEDGDELALAWDLVRQLGDQLTEARKTEEKLRREFRAAHRELESQRTRIAWLQHDIEALRADLTDAHQQNEDLAAEADQRAIEPGGSADRLSAGLNRAERRGAARRARHAEH